MQTKLCVNKHGPPAPETSLCQLENKKEKYLQLSGFDFSIAALLFMCGVNIEP